MATFDEIQLLNLAYFGRPSDPSGLAGWQNTGLNSSELVLRFVDTDEYRYNTLQPSEQGSTPNLASLINTYYNRLFDRSAAQEEINGWVDALNQGKVNVDYLGLTIANAGLNLVGSDLEETLSNKISKANGFSEALANNQSFNQKYTGWLAIDIGIEFNNSISRNTTEFEADVLEAIAFERLPDPGVLIEVKESSSTVSEGTSVGILVEGFGPDAALSLLDYVIVGESGFGAEDLVNGDLTGQITLDSNGNGVIQVSISTDSVDQGESFVVSVSGSLGSGVSTGVITVLDGPAPNATLSVSPSSTSVDEGSSIAFNIISTEIAAGTEVTYTLSGVDSADVGNAPLTGTAVLDADGKATVTYSVSQDLSFEGSETASFLVQSEGLSASTSVVINDTTPQPALNVAPSSETVDEGGSMSFFITGTSLAVGTEVTYTLSGVSSADVSNAPLTGTAVLDADGKATVTYSVAEDLSFEGNETATFSAQGAGLTASASVVINDTTPQPALNVAPSSESVDQGGSLSFFIAGTSLPVDTEVTYILSGVQSSDVSNAQLFGTAVLDADGKATVSFLISEDLSFLDSKTASFSVSGAGEVASTSVVINDFTPTQAVLTENTDIVTNTKVDGFVIIADELTLGQNDQISNTAKDALLNIGTVGDFDIANFTTSDVDTFEFITSDSFGDDGYIDMRSAFGVENLDVFRSSLDSFWFDDIQSAVNLKATLEDTFTDFYFNFDSTVLSGNNDSFDVTFAETPIDSEGWLGLVLLEGPNDESASIEILNLESDGFTENVIGALSVGSDLNALNIIGSADLLIEGNIGQIQYASYGDEAGNSNITSIDASNLDADLEFNYSSAVNGVVVVDGAVGVNDIDLSSQKGATTDFIVSTQDSDDKIFTAFGNDIISANSGDNSVFTFGGSNVISALEGNDTVRAIGGTFSDDFIDVGAGNNIVEDNGGSNTVIALGGDDTITTNGAGGDLIDAGAGNNIIRDFGGQNTITTLDGNDTVSAIDGGNDLIDVGSGNNSVRAFGGDNTVTSLDGNDVIVSTGGNDSINSGLGNDFVISGFGADTIVSAGGNNVIIAGFFDSPDIDGDGSADSVVTGAGNDTINVGDGADTVRSGAGNDYVIEGEVFGGIITQNDDGNLFELGAGNDELAMQVDNLQIDDVIDGGIGIDTITLSGGGVLRQSETLQTSNIEAFNLTGGGNFEVTLADELVASSDDISGLVRTFSIYTGAQTPDGVSVDTAGNVELDLTQISPISEGLANSPLINNIRYFGQNDSDSERVIVDDKIMNQFTELRFGELGNGSIGSDSDNNTDVLVLQDEVEITNADLQNVDGLEVIELTATTNGDISFVLDFSAMTKADFQRLVGDLEPGENDDEDDDLLIRATPSLNVAEASTLRLILPIEPDANAYVSSHIFIEESAELNVIVENGSLLAGNITTALFFTPNADQLNPDGETVIAYELNDVQPADQVEGSSTSVDTIEFRFGLANENLSMQEQLNNFAGEDVERFVFVPGAVNQAVEFNTLFGEDTGFGGPFGEDTQTIRGLESVITSGGDDFMVNIEQDLFVRSVEGNDTISSFGSFGGFGGEDFATTALTVESGSGNDSIYLLNGGNNLVISESGDDFIWVDDLFGNSVPSIGDNTVISGLGDDTIFAGDGENSIVSGLGNDTIDVADGDNTIIAGVDVDVAVISFTDNDSVTAGNGNNSITSGFGNDTIEVGDGYNTIISGLGDDTIFAGDGYNSIISGFGNDTIEVGDGYNSITSGFGDDSIEAGDGNNTIISGLGNDTIEVGDGNNSINADSGDDRVDAGIGNDTISGGIGNDSIFTGEGADLVFGDENDDIVFFGDDTTVPTDGFFTEADTVNGGLGRDVLSFSMGTVEETLTLNDRETFITGAEVRGIEIIDVYVDNVASVGTAAAVLTVDNSILKDVVDVDGVKTLDVNVFGQNGIAGSLNFDATSFVQNQAVVLTDSELISDGANVEFLSDPEDINRRQFGSGDDTYVNTSVGTPSNYVVIEGNGGADSITLSTVLGTTEYVKFNTGNDGGVGGASTGGDSVSNFVTAESGADSLDRDLVMIGSDGVINTAVAGESNGTSATGLLFDLTQRQGSFRQDAQLFGSVNEQLTLGGQTAYLASTVAPPEFLPAGGDNFLFLTGPARSLTDAQLTDASAIAQAINNVGVVSNGLSFGAEFGGAGSGYSIQQQSNQALIVQQGEFDSAVWLYIEDDLEFAVGEAHTAEASELRQLGIFNDALLTSEDFISDVFTPVTIL